MIVTMTSEEVKRWNQGNELPVRLKADCSASQSGRYAVKEIFLSLQGEGSQVGRRAVFIRFAGCNGWSGNPADRDSGPFDCAAWCDTDFVGTDGPLGGRWMAHEVALKASALWGTGREHRWVVLTGGEPLLQVNSVLVDTLHRFGFGVQVETNGTKPIPWSIDWVTVSPKAGSDVIVTTCQDLKVVYPQAGLDPKDFDHISARQRFLQPKWVDDPAGREANVKATVDYCLDDPRWRLCLQVHKIAGLR